MTRRYVPRPVPTWAVKSFWIRLASIFLLAVVGLYLTSTAFLLFADSPAAPAPHSPEAEYFGQYLADHQDDLAPFFTKNAPEIFRQGVPVIMGMLGWVIFITMLVGWGVDVVMSRGFAYFFAPAFAEIKRSVIYATGRLFLSFVYTGVLTLAIVLSLKLTFAGVVLAVAVPLLLLVALAAQLVWILYLYRTNFPVSTVFYLVVVVAHTVLGLLIAEPIIGLKGNPTIIGFVDSSITPMVKTEATSIRQQLDAASSDRNSVKAKVSDLRTQLMRDETASSDLQREIEEKKNSDVYVFCQIIQARARGELASARDQLSAFLVRFPSSSLAAQARAQLADINNQVVVVDTQKKQDAATAAQAVAAARADLLARAGRGQVTLSEMRHALLGKSRADVKELLGLPMDTGSDSWGYRQQMILNPLTNEKHGLTIYFNDGAVQGVDYDLEVGRP